MIARGNLLQMLCRAAGAVTSVMLEAIGTKGAMILGAQTTTFPGLASWQILEAPAVIMDHLCFYGGYMASCCHAQSKSMLTGDRRLGHALQPTFGFAPLGRDVQ